ncbi:thiocyanate hydrolase [Mycobacterium sp. NPDC003323]
MSFDDPIDTLQGIAGSDQTWPAVSAKHGVDNALPPWKTSLDGLTDALDHAECRDRFGFQDRRDEEDRLVATRYRHLPYPENQLMALAHSLIARGLVDESELSDRLAAVRRRLEA